jgi:hypothetical protein
MLELGIDYTASKGKKTINQRQARSSQLQSAPISITDERIKIAVNSVPPVTDTSERLAPIAEESQQDPAASKKKRNARQRTTNSVTVRQ